MHFAKSEWLLSPVVVSYFVGKLGLDGVRGQLHVGGRPRPGRPRQSLLLLHPEKYMICHVLFFTLLEYLALVIELWLPR